MSSIVFAYTSLEAFANEEIPEDFQYETERKSSGLLVSLAKESIEEKISLDEKLAMVLPKIKNKATPKGTKVWEEYVTLRRIRHRIIHLKSHDREHSKGNELYPDSIWSQLLAPSQLNYPAIAKNMIMHFLDADDIHWLKYCPF